MNFSMDNFHFDVTAMGREAFDVVMGLLDLAQPKGAVGYTTSAEYGLVLFWTMPRLSAPDMPGSFRPFLEHEKTGSKLRDFVWWWLTTDADYGHQPDHDGANSKGWRIYNQAWSHVAGRWEAYAAIQPAWAMHGK